MYQFIDIRSCLSEFEFGFFSFYFHVSSIQGVLGVLLSRMQEASREQGVLGVQGTLFGVARSWSLVLDEQRRS